MFGDIPDWATGNPHAILQNFPFSQTGFTVGAAFDVSPSVVGTYINGILIRSMFLLVGPFLDLRSKVKADDHGENRHKFLPGDIAPESQRNKRAGEQECHDTLDIHQLDKLFLHRSPLPRYRMPTERDGAGEDFSQFFRL